MKILIQIRVVCIVLMVVHVEHPHYNPKVMKHFKYMEEVFVIYCYLFDTLLFFLTEKRNPETLVSMQKNNSNFLVFLCSAIESATRNRTMIKSRSRYLNRIAYLIATKRNTLKRLALKGSARTTRRVRSIKSSARKLHRSSFRQPRKSNGKRVNRMVIKKICDN